MKLSSLLGKQVLSTAGRQGYVISLHADKDLAVFLRCADEKEREFYVKYTDVLSFGDKIIFEEQNFNSPARTLKIGKPCYDFTGAYMGAAREYTAAGGRLKSVKIGNKNFRAEGLIIGDAILFDAPELKEDVIKNGRTVFKKGEKVTEELLSRAAEMGEYVQTRLKSM